MKAVTASQAEVQKDYDLQLKFTFVGADASGKSAFCQRFTTKSPVDPSVYAPTLGCQMHQAQLTSHHKRVSVEIWDTSGSERYKPFVHDYCQRIDSLFIFVDSTQLIADNLESLAGCLKYAKAGTPIFLIFTKSDLKIATTWADVSAECAGNPDVYHLGSCSSLTGENIQEFMQQATDKVVELRQLAQIQKAQGDGKTIQVVGLANIWHEIEAWCRIHLKTSHKATQRLARDITLARQQPDCEKPIFQLISYYFSHLSRRAPTTSLQQLYPLYLRLMVTLIQDHSEIIASCLQEKNFPTDPDLCRKTPSQFCVGNPIRLLANPYPMEVLAACAPTSAEWQQKIVAYKGQISTLQHLDFFLLGDDEPSPLIPELLTKSLLKYLCEASRASDHPQNKVDKAITKTRAAIDAIMHRYGIHLPFDWKGENLRVNLLSIEHIILGNNREKHKESQLGPHITALLEQKAISECSGLPGELKKCLKLCPQPEKKVPEHIN